MDKRKELFGNTIIIFIGKMLPQVLAFFMLFIYTSYLSTSDYGYVDLIITYVSLLAPIITLQLEMAMFRFLIEVRDNEGEKRKLISNNYICLFIFCLIFIVLYLMVMIFVDFNFTWIVLLYILSTIFMSNAMQIARGLGNNKAFAIGSIINGILLVFSNVFFLVFMHYGMFGMLLSLVVSNVITFVYFVFKLNLFKFFNVKMVDFDKSKELIKYSLPLIPNGVSWWIINAADRTIISVFLGVAANGIYAVSNKFPAILSSIGTVFSLSWTESASLHIDDKDRDLFFSDVCNNALKIFASFSIFIIVLVPFVFPVIINSNFNGAYNYIPILILGALCNTMVICYSAIYIAKKLTKKVMNTSIVSAFINIVINLILIKFIGIYAAAVSTFIAYFVMLIYRHYDVQKYVQIKYDFSLIINIIIMLALVCILYYINNFYFNILSLLISFIYILVLNKSLIVLFKNIIFHRR